MAAIASSAADAATKVYEVFTDKSINPSTFSGAIDIVVIRHKNRSDLIKLQRALATESKSSEETDETKEINKNFLISTPFHVRFGKFQALRADKLPVCIKINDEINKDVAMRLNSQGIAEFIDPHLIDLSFASDNDAIHDPFASSSPAPAAPVAASANTSVPSQPSAPDADESKVATQKNTVSAPITSTTAPSAPNTPNTTNSTNTTKTATTAAKSSASAVQVKESNEAAPRARKRDKLYNYLFGDPDVADEADEAENENDMESGQNKLTAPEETSGPGRVRKRDRVWDFVKTQVQSQVSYYYHDDENDAFGTDTDNDGDEVEIISSSGNANDLERSPTPQTMANVYSLYKRPVMNVPSSDMLHKLPLQEGLNKIEFVIPYALNPSDAKDAKDAKDANDADAVKPGLRSLDCNVFLWDADENGEVKVVISDIDGTITRGDVGGQLMSSIGYDWMHAGVVELFNKIHKNGYKILYLSARGIGQADQTRHYLFKMCSQQVGTEMWKFPAGPVLLSPTTTREALYREVIQRRPQDFKIPTLLHLFYAMTLQSENPKSGKKDKMPQPYYAGFGNRVTDVASYDGVNIDKENIWVISIDKKTIENDPKKRQWVNRANYIKQYKDVTMRVDELFPPRGD